MLIGFVGDVRIDRAESDEAFDEVHDLLRAPDMLFANLESAHSDAPEFPISPNYPVVAPLRNLDAYSRAGFDVLSLANNHILDAGRAALLEARARLRAHGVATCGAGANLSEARRPALLEREGVSVAFLAYASIFPHGFEARAHTPGLVPLRGYNHFYELPGYVAAGCPPRVETIPDSADFESMEGDLRAAKADADIVVVSVHWGDYQRPFALTDHERRTAHRCIDSGADLVIGHHHHVLRGMEWYSGKPIFYGLGHFLWDMRLADKEELSDGQRAFLAENEDYYRSVDPESYDIAPRDGWPLLPMHPDSRLTALGWARVRKGSIVDVGFVPCRLRPDGRVAAVDPDVAEGREVVEYVHECIGSQGLDARISADDAPAIGGQKSVRIVPVGELR
jgi:poly-gamma-glutamate synthesis protein (capsule biosynthesis protein)